MKLNWSPIGDAWTLTHGQATMAQGVWQKKHFPICRHLFPHMGAILSLTQHVLIIDDESVIADTLALVLRQNGYQTTVAYSGEAALEIVKAMKPDVLLSDVVLGDITGIEVALRVSPLHPACRVILFSGDPVTADLLEQAEQQHGRHFEVLAKPVHPNDLLASLRAGGSSFQRHSGRRSGF